ncbi:MAG: ABC transporter permease, partial [Gemmatimonadetes bacterium]|nr:ABC transporter permease [Gemmatimonadota bacterium]
GWSQVSFAVPDFLDLREQSQTMQLAATRGGIFNLSGDIDAERLVGKYVTPGFFGVLGVQPAIGRAFTPDEGSPGNDKVAIISDGVWRRRFGADPNLVGSSIIIDGTPHTLVGVMPPHFWYRSPGQDVWTPLAFTGEETRDGHFLQVLARRNDDVTPQQALGEAQRLMGQLAVAYPETSAGHSVMMETLHRDVFDEGFVAGTLIASVGVALVLLIACANVANLLLTHAAGRDREVALRGALGAGRSRIVRQFLTESSIVAVLGGVLGVGLSVLGIRALISIMPPDFPRVHEIGLDSRVLLYTAAITMLTGIIFGLAPALQSSKTNMTDTLKEGGRGGTGSRGARLRKGLVVGEVALALILLVSSALLVQGFARVRMADLGFDRSDVLTMQVLLPEGQYPDSAVVHDFHTRLLGRLAALPGVEAVGGTDALPLQGTSMTYYVLEGEDFDDMTQRKLITFKYLLPGYFGAMDIPVLRGRAIEESDRAGGIRVAVINQATAERHWPEEDPIGQQIVTGSGSREIVGVVANTRDSGADTGDRAMVFFAAHQSNQQFMDFAIEASVPLA